MSRSFAYLTNIPSPYRAEMVRAWAECNPDVAISVFYTDPDDQGRGWATDAIGCGVKEVRLPVLASLRKYGKLNRGISAMVRDHDVIMIGGFEQASYLAAAFFAKLRRKPVILLFDGFSPGRFGTEPWAILWLKRLTAWLTDGFFANGRVGARYLREQIRISPAKPVCNQFLSHYEAPISAARERWKGASREDVRRHLGIAFDGPLLLSCGYLIERKRVDCTIEAIACLPKELRPGLLVVGSGPLAATLEAHAEAAQVPSHFAGFHQAEQLADFYFAADAMVLASSDDPWGLVVNEAMSAGLPVLVSEACGAARDLVRDGVNGFIFKPLDTQSLRCAIEHLLASDMQALGEQSRLIIQEWTASRSARNLGVIVQKVSSVGY